MSFAHRINQFLAASIGVINAILAMFLILFLATVGIILLGPFGIIPGLLVGAVFAVAIGGVLAILINIRDLLEESLRNQR